MQKFWRWHHDSMPSIECLSHIHYDCWLLFLFDAIIRFKHRRNTSKPISIRTSSEIEGKEEKKNKYYRINGFTLITDSIDTHPLFNMLEGSFACSIEWKYAITIVDTIYEWILNYSDDNNAQNAILLYRMFALSNFEYSSRKCLCAFWI